VLQALSQLLYPYFVPHWYSQHKYLTTGVLPQEDDISCSITVQLTDAERKALDIDSSALGFKVEKEATFTISSEHLICQWDSL